MAADPHDPYVDATALADLVRRGEVQPSELVDLALERVAEVDPALNTVVHDRSERARADAVGELPEGPFTGVPYLQKDLDLTVAGEPYGAGTQFLRDLDHHAATDSDLAGLLRGSGLVSIGRTNTPELGLLATTEPLATGAVHNPWAPDRSAGGSSGGAAAAVAAGLVPIAHASDGGGSIRIPASACGVVGLKPTRGRISPGPDVGESWGGLATDGMITRSVRDMATALDVMSVPAVGDLHRPARSARPYVRELGSDTGLLRVGLRTTATAGGADTHPDGIAAVRLAADLLSDLGHVIDESAPVALDDDAMADHFVTCFAVWVAREVDRLRAMAGSGIPEDGLEPTTWVLDDMGRGVDGPAYVRSLEALHAYGRKLCGWWDDGHDILVTPTMGEPPPPLGSFDATPADPLLPLTRSGELVAFTAPFNTSGQPAISLPLFWNGDGLPIGVQFVAATGREDLLLRLAAQLELVRPWAGHRPPVRAEPAERRGRRGESAVTVAGDAAVPEPVRSS